MKSRFLHICAIALVGGTFIAEASDITEIEAKVDTLASKISELQLDQRIISAISSSQDNFAALVDAIGDSDSIQKGLEEIKDNKIAVEILMQKLAGGDLIAQKNLAAQIETAKGVQTATEAQNAALVASLERDNKTISNLTAYNGDVTKLRSVSTKTASNISTLQAQLATLEAKITAVQGTVVPKEGEENSLESLNTAVADLLASVAAIKSTLVKKADKTLVTPLSSKLDSRASIADYNDLSTKVDKVLQQKVDQSTVNQVETDILKNLDALEDSLTKILNEKAASSSSDAGASTSYINSLQQELDKAKVALASHMTDVSILSKNITETDSGKASSAALKSFERQVDIQMAAKAATSDLLTIGADVGHLQSTFNRTKEGFDQVYSEMNTLSSQLDEFGTTKVTKAAFDKVRQDQPQIQGEMSDLQDRAGVNSVDVSRIAEIYEGLAERLKTLWTDLGTLGDSAHEHNEEIVPEGYTTAEAATTVIETLQTAIDEAKAGLEEDAGEEEEEQQEEPDPTTEEQDIAAFNSAFAEDGTYSALHVVNTESDFYTNLAAALSGGSVSDELKANLASDDLVAAEEGTSWAQTIDGVSTLENALKVLKGVANSVDPDAALVKGAVAKVIKLYNDADVDATNNVPDTGVAAAIEAVHFAAVPELGEITTALGNASSGYAFYGKTADAIYDGLNGKVADVSNFVTYANTLDAVAAEGEGAYLGTDLTASNIGALKTVLASVSAADDVTDLEAAASATYADVDEALSALKAIVEGVAYVAEDSSDPEHVVPAKYTYGGADADASDIVAAMKQAMSQVAERLTGGGN